ncbi:pseudouridine synthase deg1 [Coemansia interrupta]|uniref:Pseudouridine synthase deg1 n=1 Tax=Coemansia interrupta TaxID=1126814 RepID=A0A9W8H386_9FUNG|nr:pseudouridine synthase deg1 [Coemansia interrupta]
MDYESWTKEALISRLRQLEPAPTEQPPSDTSMEPPKRKKQRRAADFDFSKFPQRKIALKFSYFGWPYHGLARQGNALGSAEKQRVEEQYPTVEGELFKALAKCKLIENEDTCGYSRCGRTDRGVSGLGQVAALYVRSNGKFIGEEEEEGVEGAVTQAQQNGGRRVLLPNADAELPYVSMLNRNLPAEIRVLAWSPVSDSFDARFSCRSRFYRYFFSEAGLDISLMRDAAARFQGTHDFRNFCRLDPAKQIKNFERTVLSIAITEVPLGMRFAGNGAAAEARWWQLELRGTAFLWHQVRCMMAVLFLVGQGLETPDIVDRMMDVGTMDGKPEYEMASDIPLVLADCAFDAGDLRWNHVHGAGEEYGNMRVLDETVGREWGMLQTRTLVAGALLETLRTTHVPVKGAGQPASAAWDECREKAVASKTAGGVRTVLGGGQVRHVSRYVKMAERKRAMPVDVRNRAWAERKGIKTADGPADGSE